jgi:hypothetical protein
MRTVIRPGFLIKIVSEYNRPNRWDEKGLVKPNIQLGMYKFIGQPIYLY